MSWQRRILYSGKTGRLVRGHPPMMTKRKACMHVIDLQSRYDRTLTSRTDTLKDKVDELCKFSNELMDVVDEIREVVNNNAQVQREMADVLQQHVAGEVKP